jgi:hypothetical protein
MVRHDKELGCGDASGAWSTEGDGVDDARYALHLCCLTFELRGSPTAWRAGQLAQNGPQALRLMASVPCRWASPLNEGLGRTRCAVDNGEALADDQHGLGELLACSGASAGEELSVF